ncbi:hypothetical protein JRQ81_005344 [Phrynocephalus forsythii]|uniref:Uncharacterized protein n=1 Tax=Phrynocephalus forsythii TaxID=171643 RepID=A0A9Q1B6Q8_9SAUR|nr:hypothetical protein JRQ81_005344 [Phrynocephalus forsythii]
MMAPTLPRRAEPVASETPRKPSALLLGGLSSVAPVIMMILLLLLCFPFKRKKRALAAEDHTRDLNASELLSMVKLEDGLSPEEKSLGNGELSKGNCLPNFQSERPINGMASTELRQESADSPTVTPTMSRTPQRFAQRRKMEADPLRGTAPQGLCPRAASPSALQCRKLPLTPKEAHVSQTEPLNQDVDNNVYESICHEERGPGASVCMETSGDPNSTGGQDSPVESMGLVGNGGRTVAFGVTTGQPASGWQHTEWPGQLPGVSCEQETPLQAALDTEKRLSAMYARVCKRPKASPQQRPADDGKPAQREEEEEPPPIPERIFEDLYESLSIETEVQDGAMAGVTLPSEA